MVYQWKSASHIKANANEAGAMCERLERTVGLTPANLLDANRANDAPLHNEFEWDDAIAAEEYRLQQARHIISCLCVKSEEDKTHNEPIRAFFKIEPACSEYESLQVILSTEDKYKSMLKTAAAELKAFQKKYQALKELKPLFDVISEMGDINA